MADEPTPDEMMAALIELHRGLERMGPGDPQFSREILAGLPALPEAPRIADLGCGAGAGALLLAETFGVPVIAVDGLRAFLDQLEARAHERGLASLVRAVEADFAALDWPAGSIDLLWSEGAAYHLTFAGAVQRWRPLVAQGGVAVISEASWWTETPAAAAREYWAAGYPTMGTEATNAARAREAGFAVLSVHRLPARAWWDNYYGPRLRRVDEVRETADAAMRAAIRETEAEVAMFRAHAEDYGYSFYVLRAV
ncbi:class I SAM-dependent methyltransferase [Nannocystis sp. ILAH1]|uniref:class I SAM-dependent methyltransferase n=1 Tax=unclassified Nannocystis TaxID=2627009 RepID=UPI00227159A4|nr:MULTISPECIES: class I SAM-dependent methyltransferase [unclassified Nannocystis]MCY0992423.1 class I SAM-dependent methyltransferase [Nannocystis sp. ILAH1]MCY1068989.1 class I SAM-dependent methyltransferase [Nannocystis sp. RBIL2]